MRLVATIHLTLAMLVGSAGVSWSTDAQKNSSTQVPINHEEPIYHEKYYPKGTGPFPAVIALHTSGGFKTVAHLIQNYVDDGFVVYAPDFFRRHGLTPKTRMKTFTTYRASIEKELSIIVSLMKLDKKINENNIFAVGFSNGGFWVSYLAGTSKVRAGASHYGVWKANFGREFTNPYPMKYFSRSSSPILALHGVQDGTQRLEWAERALAEIGQRGARTEKHFYRDAGHAWDRKNPPKRAWKYNEEVTKDSHRRTIEFFETQMKTSN